MNDDRHAKRQAGDAETGAQAEQKGHADESAGLRRRNGPEHVWAARRQDPRSYLIWKSRLVFCVVASSISCTLRVWSSAIFSATWRT